MVRQDGEAVLGKRRAQDVAQKAGASFVVDGTGACFRVQVETAVLHHQIADDLDPATCGQCVPVPAMAAPEEDDKPALPLSHYISWSQLLKRTFEIDTVCPRCKTPLRLIAMIETEDTIKEILSAMGLPTEAPKLRPARPPPAQSGGEGGYWLN